MDTAEEAILRAMLVKHNGMRNKVAKELGINRTTLFNKMQKFGLMDVFQRHRKKDE
jgi:transcriptional regulator with PAS, ATPase and Fis domain